MEEREEYIPRYEYEQLESDYRRLMRKYEETEAYKADLERLVSKARSPPLDCGFVVEKTEEGAIVNLNGALKALPYGTLTAREVAELEEGKYVFIGRIPDRNSPNGFSVGITKVYDRFVDLEVGEVEELRKDEDGGDDSSGGGSGRGRGGGGSGGGSGGWVAEISTGRGRGRIFKRLTEEQQEGLKVGTKVGLLPGTFDIKRSFKQTEISHYEVTKSPGVSFNEIGGLKEVKQELVKSVILPMLNPEDYAKYGECSRRILMYGLPGCGKTMCAKALASALPNCEFVKVGAGELFSMWLGESEKNVRMIFESANAKLVEGENDYGVIFFDEIDALAQERGMYSGSSGAPERVTGQLLDLLEGFHALHPHLTVIGATNRLHLIDSAFRARFDKIIEVPKPDKEAVRSIASLYARKIPIDHLLIKEAGGGEEGRGGEGAGEEGKGRTEGAGEEEARARLVSEIVDYMCSENYVETEIGRIKRADTITGRFIAQIFNYARDKALEERTLLMLKRGAISNDEKKEEIRKMWDKEGIAAILDAERKTADLERRYKRVEEIGVNMRHLKEGFDKFVQRRAEEILASGYGEMPDEETGMHY